MANEANDEMCCTQSALQFINIHVLWSYKPLLSVLQARTRYLVHWNNELQQKSGPANFGPGGLAPMSTLDMLHMVYGAHVHLLVP